MYRVIFVRIHAISGPKRGNKVVSTILNRNLSFFFSFEVNIVTTRLGQGSKIADYIETLIHSLNDAGFNNT